MPRAKRVSFSPINYDRDGICAAQQLVGAGALTLDGALVSGGAWTAASTDAPHAIDLYSGGNLSGVNFTVTGTNQWGVALSEVIAGPSGGTVTTTGFFKTVTGVSAGGAVGSDVEVGPADEIAFAYVLDLYRANTAIWVDVSGTINYTVQKCGERMSAGETPNWVAGGLATQTADNNTAYTAPTGGVRLKVNSYTNGATIAMSIVQARDF